MRARIELVLEDLCDDEPRPQILQPAALGSINSGNVPIVKIEGCARPADDRWQARAAAARRSR